MLDKDSCCICSQILGEKSNDLIAQMLREDSYIRRVPLETNQFAVIPSLGPLVPGHTLLCPKEHYRSFAGLPKGYDVEYQCVKGKLTSLLEQAYGAPIHYFEHGMAPMGDHILCTVEHAHLHFVPADINNLWPVLEKRAEWNLIEEELEDLRRVAGGAEYLFYESPNKMRKVAKVETGEFESQYLRRVFAESIGKQVVWDWRKVPAPLETHSTYEKILSAAGGGIVSQDSSS